MSRKCIAIIATVLMLMLHNADVRADQDGLEIVFVMDSSGSVKQAGWDAEKEFIVELVEPALPEYTRIGIVRFASSAEKIWYFTDDQDKSEIIDQVNSLSWTQGATAIRTALNNAIDIFQYTSDGLSHRVIILITDGNPYPQAEQNPCKTSGSYSAAARRTRNDLQDLSIKTIIVGIGDNWTPAILSCLVDNEEDIVEVASFDSLGDAVSIVVSLIVPDADNDGVLDNVDLCPDTAPGGAVDAAGCSDTQVDEDSDGVCDLSAVSNGPSGCVGADFCPDTLIPEGVPTKSLGVNRWALVDGDGVFDTTLPSGGGEGPQLAYTIEETAGCSCEQIITILDLGKGHEKFGCSISAMEDFVELVNP